jgi:hypothetical protein
MEISKTPLSPRERFELAREQIKHEDTLSNNRASWLILFQGLLFTAFVNSLGLLPETYFATRQYFVVAGIVCLAAVGMVASVIAFLATRAGLAHTLHVECWWKCRTSTVSREWRESTEFMLVDIGCTRRIFILYLPRCGASF